MGLLRSALRDVLVIAHSLKHYSAVSAGFLLNLKVKNMSKLILGSLAALILALAGLVATLNFEVKNKEVPIALSGVSQGTEGSIATSSVITMPATTATTITIGRTATSSACSSRAITTNASIIRLAFSTTTPYEGTPYFQVAASNVNGNTKAVSKTVVYDSQFWGCGAIQAFSYSAQVLTILETQ